MALIPVGAILYVSAVQLGASTLKDLALALFVGMAAGAYSSIFIATPLLVQMKAGETDVMQAEKRDKARQKASRPTATPSVPVFAEDLPVGDEPDDDDEDLDATSSRSRPGPPTAPPRSPEASSRGRIAPGARGPVQQSNAAGRQQPSRQPKSKRGKK